MKLWVSFCDYFVVFERRASSILHRFLLGANTIMVSVIQPDLNVVAGGGLIAF